MSKSRKLLLGAAGLTVLTVALACGGGGPGSNVTYSSTPNPGAVAFMTSDATSETWSKVGIIIRKASLVLASDTAAARPVVIYDGAADTTPVDLLQEDEINDLLSQATNVPAGTYDRLIVEVDGSASNITLVPAADPATGIVPAAIPTAQLVVKGNATDMAHPTWMVLPTITLASPITVSASQTAAVAVDFDLAHPAFIVEHDTQGGTPLYVVAFGAKNAFRHKAAATLDAYYLRRHLGTVTAVGANGASFTLLTEHGQTLTIQADKTAGSLFYNLNGTTPGTPATLEAVPATLVVNDAVACTARFQTGGSLAAVRVWYTTGAPSTLPAWTPEGHILKVDTAQNRIWVLDSTGDAQPITIAPTTKWFFHGGTMDLANGSGTTFLKQVERFFKVHVLVDPLGAAPATALSVDIQRAVFEGHIVQAPAPSTTSFAYTKVFSDLATATHTLGFDPAFSFWDFTFPATAQTNLPAFDAEAASGITLNNSGKQFMPYGASSLAWATATSTWGAVDTRFLPVALSAYAQNISAAYATGTGALTVRAVDPGSLPVTVTLDATAQDQPLVTLYTRSGATVAVTPLATTDWATYLTQNAKVRVFGVPDGNGHLKGYYVNLYR